MVKTSDFASVLIRPTLYDLNFRITSFCAWRFLSFVSGFCSVHFLQVGRHSNPQNCEHTKTKTCSEGSIDCFAACAICSRIFLGSGTLCGWSRSRPLPFPLPLAFPFPLPLRLNCKR